MIAPAEPPYGAEGWVAVWLPVPPSVNKYWRRGKSKTYRSKSANEFRARARELVRYAILAQKASSKVPFDERMEIELVYRPPDRRPRDLDNILKAVLDALCYGSLITDDELFDRITLVRGPVSRAKAGVYLRVRRTTPIDITPQWASELRP